MLQYLNVLLSSSWEITLRGCASQNNLTARTYQNAEFITIWPEKVRFGVVLSIMNRFMSDSTTPYMSFESIDVLLKISPP